MARKKRATFGRWLAKTRKEEGITQRALAVKLGVSHQAIGQWELDKCRPALPTLFLLYEELGVLEDGDVARLTRLAAA